MENTQETFEKYYKYKDVKYNSMEEALKVYLLDGDKKRYDSVVFHTRSDYSGIPLTGLNNDGTPWFTQSSDDRQYQEVVDGLKTFNNLTSRLTELKTEAAEKEIQELERTFDKHYSYKGERYNELEPALKAFLVDDNKSQSSPGVVYHTRNNNYGMQLTGVGHNGDPWYTQLSDDWRRQEVKAGFNTFQELAGRVEELRAEANFDKHFTYEGERYDSIESALAAFINNDKKRPDSRGIVYHNKSVHSGIDVTGVNNRGEPWFTQFREHLAIPEIQKGVDMYNDLMARTSVVMNNINDKLSNLKDRFKVQEQTNEQKMKIN